ncbi:MAG: outer membrane protein assembly factor BamD, partial [Cytophagaceae bacterium]
MLSLQAMPKGRFNILLFAVLSLTIFSCSKFDKIQRSDNLEEKLQAAFDYYEKKDYHKASVLFEELVPLLRGRSESEKASFYQANCHYHQKQYIMSSYYYRDFIETFPRSEYTEDARFYYAKSLY